MGFPDWYHSLMIMSSDHFTASAGAGPGRAAVRPGRGRWLSAVVAASAAAVIAVAGCSSGSKAPAAGGTGGGKPLTAHQAIKLAATASAKVNSLTATLTVRGASGSAGGLTGSMKIQVKPTVLLDATFNVAGAGAASSQIEEILTHNTIYFRDSALTRVAGKPWIKIGFSQLSSKLGLNFASLVQNLEGSNPLAQTRLFAVSENIHVVGHQVVNGVPCTEYQGSYKPGAALAALPPSFRKLLGPMLRKMGAQPAEFTVWIDGQHLLRKALTHEVIAGQPVTTSYDVTSINQPVTVTIPPASQVGSLPGL